MTPLELCEPVFQKVCLLYRSARTHPDRFHKDQVRAEFRAMIEELRARSSAAAETAGLTDRIVQVVIYFVDSMMLRSRLALAPEWEPLAVELLGGDVTGDDNFFTVLDETLSDRTEAATRLLPVFYTAIGLGFAGAYASQPEFLQRKTQEIAARIRPMMDDHSQRITPDAYEHVNTENLVRPPGVRLLGMGLALALLLVLLFVVNLVLYRGHTAALREAVAAIHERWEDGRAAGASIENPAEVK